MSKILGHRVCVCKISGHVIPPPPPPFYPSICKRTTGPMSPNVLHSKTRAWTWASLVLIQHCNHCTTVSFLRHLEWRNWNFFQPITFLDKFWETQATLFLPISILTMQRRGKTPSRKEKVFKISDFQVLHCHMAGALDGQGKEFILEFQTEFSSRSVHRNVYHWIAQGLSFQEMIIITLVKPLAGILLFSI